MIRDAVLLNSQHYKVRIKGKVEQSREKSSALPYTHVQLLMKRKTSGLPKLRSPTYIYIYIFFFHHTTCGSTCDTLASSAANQGDNTVSVALRLELPKLCYHPGWRLMRLGYRTCFHTLYDEYIYIYIYVRDVLVTVVGNEYGDLSSNPGRGFLYFPQP